MFSPWKETKEERIAGDVEEEIATSANYFYSSISITCWVVVFSPQIIENFRRGSADGLSLLFLIVWLAGDVFNILGAVLQRVLPTMVILAVYYTLADIVLLGQCFYYRGFTLQEPSSPVSRAEDSGPNDPGNPSSAAGNRGESSERTALLSRKDGQSYQSTPQPHHSSAQNSQHAPPPILPPPTHRRHSAASALLHPIVDGTHLSPATPFIEPTDPKDKARRARQISTIQSILIKTSAVALVCAAGILGWYVSPASTSKPKDPSTPDDSLKFDTLGQIFGYLCAVLYLGSRLPQILLNYRRKSTDGVSLLFFLFACIGNLTYVLSILAYSPVCPSETGGRCSPSDAAAQYGQYVLVNLSWLIGSFGTLVLDMCIFVQFFLYQEGGESDEEASGESSRG